MILKLDTTNWVSQLGSYIYELIPVNIGYHIFTNWDIGHTRSVPSPDQFGNTASLETQVMNRTWGWVQLPMKVPNLGESTSISQL